jgi:UDP-N-acetylmuramate-alanine ligase
MALEAKSMAVLGDVVALVETKTFDVLITMGAGNIDIIIDPLTKMLNEKYLQQ